MQKIAYGRIFGLMLALIGIGLSIYGANEAISMNSEFHGWYYARPMETIVDLSKTGEITVPFRQTCSISHSEVVCFACDLNDESKENLQQLFNGLSMNLIIKDSEGKEIINTKINSKLVHYQNGEIILTGFAPFETGDYLATIRVDSSILSFSGKRQTIYVKYRLCGLEQMPAVIDGLLAFVAGVIGVVSTICVLPGVRRYGIRRPNPTRDV